MSYSIKKGKLAKRKWKNGDIVHVSYGRDMNGQYWWAEAQLNRRITQIADNIRRGGPFRTAEEAERDFQVTILGPQCKVEDGGMWDPAWDRPQ